MDNNVLNSLCLSMCVYEYVRLMVYSYVCMYMNMFVCLLKCICVCVCMCVCVCVCLCVCECMHKHMCACVTDVSLYIYLYVYVCRTARYTLIKQSVITTWILYNFKFTVSFKSENLTIFFINCECIQF